MAELRRAPVRGVWSTEEDEALKAAVRAHGVKSWAVVSTVRSLAPVNAAPTVPS
jgi:hypothetical protein